MILDRLSEELSDLAVVEQRPNLDGRNMTMLLGPSKAVLSGTLDRDGDENGASAPAEEAAESAPAEEAAEATPAEAAPAEATPAEAEPAVDEPESPAA
jgi:translation initiation factor IF-3